MCPFASTCPPEHFHSLHSTPTKLFSMWMVLCVTFHKMLFCKGINVWGGEILTSTKWRQKLKCNIFFLKHKNNFIANWSSMLLEDVMELLSTLMPQIFVDFLFSLEDMNNSPCQLNIKTHYYLTYLRSMYFACQKLPCGKKKSNIVHWQWIKQGL